MEGSTLSDAYEWLAENPTESVAVAAQLFHVPKSSLQSHITRKKAQHRGQNKMLTTAQMGALKQ